MAQDMPIGALLAEEGFNTIASSRTAREALVRYGLTNHRKKNIAVKKLSRVREVLTREFYRACDDPWCQTVGVLEAEGREIVTVAGDACQVCGGKKSCRSLKVAAVSYTNLTLPTNRGVWKLVGVANLRKTKKQTGGGSVWTKKTSCKSSKKMLMRRCRGPRRWECT